jgi:ribose transport system ATP-binding protein
MTDTKAPVLELNAISRSFGPVKALSEVNVSVDAGQILAIVGENGAGKSTLVNISAGAISASSGEIRMNGRKITETSTTIMREAGLSIAYQHPALPPDLTVQECLALVAPGFIGAEGRQRTAALLARIATPTLCADPRQLVAELNIAQRHVVEIARALASDPQVIIFDEPTEPFTEDDILQLFRLITELKAEGKAVIYISHRLQDVMQIADRISVLRDGQLVDDRDAKDFSPDQIVELIVGQPLDQTFPHKSSGVDTARGPVADIKSLHGRGFSDVSLRVHSGEIVGLVGVEGQGQREFIRALAGAESPKSGEIVIAGDRLSGHSAAQARNAGIGFVPDDRHHEGIFLPLSVRENLSLGLDGKITNAGVVSSTKENEHVKKSVGLFRVKTGSLETPVSALSGGNQQKVLIGREIAAEPRILLVDEPTKGVDVGARLEIYQQLRNLSENGVPVIVCSSDGVEVEGLCDRVLVFSRGRVVKELTGAEVTDSNITEANLHAGDGTSKRAERNPGDATAATGRRRGLISPLYYPIIPLAILIFVAGAAATYGNVRFLSAFSLGQVLLFVSALGFVAFAQLCTILMGEIDLSVGPLVGFVVVLSSYLLPSDVGNLSLMGGAIAVLAICALIGLFQGLIIIGLRLPSVVVTLGSFFGLQGLSLLLRPLPAGSISITLHDVFAARYWVIPFVFSLLLVTSFVLEHILRRSHIGRSLRALGSDPSFAYKLGVSRMKIGLLAFAASGVMTGIAGLIVAGEVGIGAPSTGIDYTLMSITAVVLGGAAITGGRGSFFATAFGAGLVQMIMSTTPFLRMGIEWNYWITGATTLAAAALFTHLRRRNELQHH